MKKQSVFTFFIALVTLFTNSVANAQAQSCPAGQFWDTRVNRCMITLKNAKAKQEAARCKGLTGDEFKECFNKNAANTVSDLESDDEMKTYENGFKKGNATKIIVPLTITLITSYYLFLNKKKFEGCKNTSMWLLFGGGVAGLIGEVSAQITYNSKTKNLADEYKEKMKDAGGEKKYQDMTDNQTLAFDYLIEAEEARKSAEKIRKGAYTLSALLYTGALAMAVVETAQVGFGYGAACDAQASYDKRSLIKKHYDKLVVFSEEFSGYEHQTDMTSAEFLEIIARKIYSNIIPAAYAQDNNSEYIEYLTYEGEDKMYINKNDGKLYKVDDDGGYTLVPNAIPMQQGQTFIGQDGNSYQFQGAGKGFQLNNQFDEVVVTACKNGEEENGDCKKDNGVIDFMKEKYGDIIKSDTGKKQMNAVDKAMATPYIRAALATALGLYANELRKDARDNIEIAQNRIDALTKIRDDFVASGGAGLVMCKDDDREDSSKPNCFCYTEDGSFDDSKRKLTICKQLAVEFDLKQAKKYGWKHGAMDTVKVCVDEGNNLDTFCKCKSKKSKSGKGNACTKISSRLNISGLGGNSWLKGLSAPADSLLNGKLDGSQLDTTDLNKKALALQKKLKKMEKDPKYGKAIKKASETSLKMQKAHKSWFKKSFPNGAPRSLASNSLGSSAPIPTSAKDVIKAAEKNVANSNEVKYKDGGKLGSAKKSEDSLDFGWGDEGAKGGVKIDEIAKVMDKNYAIKGDINKNPSHDIFKILSNRYQRSGLRRLFDTEGVSKADEADSTDINEQ
jgi:hypothetical protein